MYRWDVINSLIENFNYKSYLEIGVRRRGNFNRINCMLKDGVDPNGQGNYKATSDKFFSLPYVKKKKWDIIFIDGLHIDEQVNRDIKNSLKHLTEGGTIVMHDCNPPTFKHQQVPRIQKAWNGSVWKSFVRLRCKNPNLEMFVIKVDWGCGIIRKGKQKIYKNATIKEIMTYLYFDKNRKELLNLINYEDYLHWLTKNRNT